MLVASLAVFTLVAAMGLMVVRDVWRGRPIDPVYPKIHAAAALLGSLFVILVALDGDTRLYTNIGMAVVIIGLGVMMALYSRKGKRVPQKLVAAHVALAVSCYVILAYYAFTSR